MANSAILLHLSSHLANSIVVLHNKFLISLLLQPLLYIISIVSLLTQPLPYALSIVCLLPKPGSASLLHSHRPT